MIIEAFPQFVFDELPEKPDHQKLYILSRPIYKTPVYNSKNQIHIITTDLIKKFLSSKKENPIPSRLIHSLEQLSKFEFKPKPIWVHLIETNSPSRNVMFLLEHPDDENSKVLYTGQFVEYDHLFNWEFKTKNIQQYLISDLYIDNTFANTENHNSIGVACQSIDFIVRKNKNLKIYIWMDYLGCENLLIKLASEYKFKIRLNLGRRILLEDSKFIDLFNFSPDEVQLLIMEDRPVGTYVQFKKMYEQEQTLIIQILTTENHIPIIGKISDGIISVCYAPHPTKYDLYNIALRIKPKRILPIMYDLSGSESCKIPECILNCCFKQSRMANQQVDDEMDLDSEINNFDSEHSSSNNSKDSFLNTSSCDNDDSDLDFCNETDVSNHKNNANSSTLNINNNNNQMETNENEKGPSIDPEKSNSEITKESFAVDTNTLSDSNENPPTIEKHKRRIELKSSGNKKLSYKGVDQVTYDSSSSESAKESGNESASESVSESGSESVSESGSEAEFVRLYND